MTIRLTLATLLCLGAACAHSPSAAKSAMSLTPAQRHALLLNPTDPFWQAHAPAVYEARVETTKGPFVLEITRDWAPRGADRFYNLARAGYYDDTRFSRVVPKFIAQFGFSGEPAVAHVWMNNAFADDPVKQSSTRGTIAFAMTGPNTRTTQLYISVVDNSRLDAQGFSPLGRVIEGMNVVDSLYSGYGENSGGGVRAGKQGPLIDGGNAYVDREFPKLDHLIRITIIDRK